MAHQPMQTGDPDVVHRLHAVTHHFRSHRGFFGHGYIGRARGKCQDSSLAADHAAAADDNRAGERMELSSGAHASDGAIDLVVRTRNQDVVRRLLRPQHSADYRDHLSRRFSAREDYFSKALAQRSMMIDFG